MTRILFDRLFATALITTALLATAMSSHIVAAEPSAVETILATRGQLLLHDDGTIVRGGPKTFALGKDTSVRASAGKWKKNPDNGAWRSTWPTKRGHIPVASYHVAAKDLIVEVSFRLALDNRERLTGHILSAWANPNHDFIESGFLLQHIHKTPEKEIIKDLLLDRQPLAIKALEWQTAVLEVVGDETLFRMGPHVAYAKFDELKGQKTKVSLTLGKTWHEVKRVRVWEATANPKWSVNKEKTLSTRRQFSAMPHQYQAPAK
jgi:hypothetical protein